SGHFAGHVDAGATAESQHPHEARYSVYAQVVGEHVVVGIAGNDDRPVHVDYAVAADLVVAENVAAEVEKPRIADHLLGRAFTGGQSGERHERLESGARGVRARQRAVEQRPLGRGVELAPVLWIDAVDEEIGVETRLAHERKHSPRSRLYCNQRSAVVAEGV